jgi:hypothetical protein
MLTRFSGRATLYISVPRSCEFASLNSDVRRFGDPGARMASQSLHDYLDGDAWNYLLSPGNSDAPLSGIPFPAVWLHSCCSPGNCCDLRSGTASALGLGSDYPKGSNLGRTNGPDPWEPVDHTAKPHHHNFSARVRAISASDRNRLTRSL